MKAHRDLLIAAALVALTIGLTTGGAAQKGGGGGGTAPPPPKDKIVFTRSFGNGAYELFTMRSDGTLQTQLSFAGGQYRYSWQPVFLADGRIVFGRGTTGNAEVCIVNADGTGYRTVAVVPDYTSPIGTVIGTEADDLSVSPDGKFIAFSANQISAYVVRTDGSGTPLLISHREVWPSSEYVLVNDWSPDLDPVTPGYQGKLLVGRARGTIANLAAFDIWDDGAGNPVSGEVETLVLAGAGKAKWSPDGMRLAMIDTGGSIIGGWTGSFLKAIDIPWSGGLPGLGGQPVFPLDPATRYQVANNPSKGIGYQGVNWCPDSKQLVVGYRFRYGSDYDVAKVAIPVGPGGTKGTLIQLTTNGAWEGHGSWSRPIF